MVRRTCVAPHDGVVTDRSAGRMVERAEDRVPGSARRVETGSELLDVVRTDHLRVDLLELVHLGAPAHRSERRVGVGKGQVTSLRKHHVDVQVDRHRVVELQRPVVERHALGRQVVGSDDRCVPSRSATAEIRLVENCDVGNAVVRCQIVSGGEAVDAAPDHHHVVG